MSSKVFTQGKNTKIASNTAIFNLPPVKTCINCKTCQGSCYAKFRYRFKTVKQRWDNNYNLSKDNDFVKKANIELKYRGCKIVRFHESGDFYNTDYIRKWAEIMACNSDVMFFGYTKNKNALILNKLANCNIIYSLIETEHGELRNYGNIDYCNYLRDTYNVFICPHDDTWKKQGKKCMVDCTACLTLKSVCFVEHGQYKKSDKYSKEILDKINKGN